MFPTWEGNKEARCAIIYEPDWDAARTPEGEVGLRKEYLATTDSRESLVRAACARAQARAGGGVVAVVGDGAAAAAAWRATMRQALLEQGPPPLLAALRAWEPEGETAAEVKRIQLAYFERQQARMQYPEYLRRGLPIGSGAVEGACKHVVADRFDGS